MNASSQIFTGGRIFDGEKLHDGMGAQVTNGVFVGLLPAQDIPATSEAVPLEGDILSFGYVDLQVNGGDGLMFNDDPSVETLRRMALAHRRLGVVRFLPTLITDTAQKTQAAITAVQTAIAQGVTGIAGLHLEGPHLSVARKGAHDARYIRAMTDADLRLLINAKMDLPVLKVTLAPETVTPAQVTDLANAGVLVSLGHSDTDFDTALSYAAAGARLVTHLFNAMSGLTSRAPGLVGATLHHSDLSAGMIADAVHVHPATMRMAFAAKQGPGQIFLVSDAMAVAGTDLSSFELDGRRIERRAGQLRLADGTLAGADLDLTTAISVLVEQVGIDLETALCAATSVPARVAGLPRHGLDAGGTPLRDLIRIRSDLSGATPLIP